VLEPMRRSSPHVEKNEGRRKEKGEAAIKKRPAPRSPADRGQQAV
jgi:hypothetical protein